MPTFLGATPAPLRDRIKGSRINQRGSAASSMDILVSHHKPPNLYVQLLLVAELPYLLQRQLLGVDSVLTLHHTELGFHVWLGVLQD